jgi:membrane protein implicated in regulation of membrane protease activity
MIIYNIFTELILPQLLIVLILALASCAGVHLVNKKFKYKFILLSIISGIVLTLLSLLIARGRYGGTMYHESFG